MSRAAAWLLLAALARPPLASAQPLVRVRVLERLHPHDVQVQGQGQHALVASAWRLLVDGVEVEQPYLLPEAEWTVRVPGEAPRHYQGTLLARAVRGELALVLQLPLERYVALVVASETTPGTAAAALQAQAVVARSFLLAQGPRHADADACDLAHCQLLRGSGVSPAHRAAARAAAAATAGRVLVLATGAIAETPFHAACGGHTAAPEEVFGSATTGALAVPDTGCPPHPWAAVVPLRVFQAALAPLLDAPASAQLLPEALHAWRGQGGYVTRVLLPGAGGATGDAVARGLDRALGFGAVRSGRFDFHSQGPTVRVQGTGLGHGLGLCQAGAALRAARGETYPDILRHYFPLASLR